MDKIFQLSLVTWGLIKETATWFLIGLFIAGLIHQLIPDKLLQKYLGGKGFFPIIWASLIGILLPVCSCGIVPISFALHKKGVAIGPCLALLVAAPAVNPASIGLSISILGFELTLGYVLTVGFSAIILGVLANLFIPDIQYIGGKKKCGCCNVNQHHSEIGVLRENLISGINWAFNNLAVELAPALVYGFFVAGILTVFIPADIIKYILGSIEIFSYIITAFLGVIMFVCNVGAIPFIASLINQGAFSAIAIVFLITGPATNISQLLMLNKAFGRRAMILYLILLPLLSIISAVIFQCLFPEVNISFSMNRGNSHASSFWGIVFISVLVLALLKSNHKHRH
ncbi:hypothetical protein SAMN02745227_00309 [Anaerobranca californiensis DSM 14826]|jgi:uncharacterized membrane protein YraQ (UPF0718 family)|uniref:Permease n=1 Tax=Anaerobranca californiensis DSM 14826 TaxID=1120989 RepID=A0A1M6KZ84_9FIRM|nr:permease [Anaerobranca californiensis]SHJ64305.1 hypothetical protein SAMN02745227_00309 [Anaerobranca californiensis DSM 14826]